MSYYYTSDSNIAASSSVDVDTKTMLLIHHPYHLFTHISTSAVLDPLDSCLERRLLSMINTVFRSKPWCIKSSITITVSVRAWFRLVLCWYCNILLNLQLHLIRHCDKTSKLLENYPPVVKRCLQRIYKEIAMRVNFDLKNKKQLQCEIILIRNTCC